MLQKWLRYLSVTALLVFLWTTVETAWAGDLQVWVKQKATVERNSVILGDIATFHPENDERVEALREIQVAAAPAPGRDLALTSRFLVYRLSSLMGKDPDVRVKIPQELLIHRTGQLVSVKKLTTIFKNYVFRQAPWPKESITVDKVKVSGPVFLPHGRVSWEIRERTNGNFIGEKSLVIVLKTDDKVYRKVVVRGHISVKRKIIRAAKKIEKDSIIEGKYLSQFLETTDKFSKDAAFTLDQVIGKRARMTILSGRVIKLSMLEVPPTVKKGDRVIIRAENGSIVITTVGRVLGDARSGEQVRVINVMSGKELFARVVGQGRVAVRF